MTHAELCALAVRWLRRPNAAGGHGCQVAVSECRADYQGEAPDAIGFRTGWMAGSVVVECKTSRADFHADKAKPHRAPGKGMGTWRYFMAPARVILAEFLPAGWGLLEVNARGHVKAVRGAALHARTGVFAAALSNWKQSADVARERDLLTKLLARVGDVEAMNRRIREAEGARDRFMRACDKERKQHGETRAELAHCRMMRGD